MVLKIELSPFQLVPLCTHILSAADPADDPVSHLPYQGLQPDGVIHIISPWIQAFAAHHANHQERRAANEHILAQRICVLGKQVLYYGLAKGNNLSSQIYHSLY